MTFSETIFRFRRWVLLLIVGFGFWAPWERLGGAHPGSTWLFLAGLLAHWGVLPIGDASIAVMAAAILCALLAALLRTWGAAYLGRAVVHDAALHGERVVADGPYRYVRNPLYIGTWLNVAALAILMPPEGALFALVAAALVTVVKVGAEERRLTAESGEGYLSYTRRVPRFFCAIMPRIPAGGARARWGEALLSEIYMWGVFLTYAIFAGRYNVTVLEQGVLISLGIGLLVRGLWRPPAQAIS